MSSSIKQAAGYFVGFIVFIVAIPGLMFCLAGQPVASVWQTVCFAVCAIAGLGLSVWSIIYMKKVGGGNPLDAFNHEIGPRTQRLMTGGPYRLCRNPMLLGVFLYYTGIQLYLLSGLAFLLFLVFVSVMIFQVKREEQRLEHDFGRAYLEYRQNTPAFLPRFGNRH